MKRNNLHAENTKKYLSQEVREELNKQGYSFLFNWDDYYHFRSLCKDAFNRAHAIAQKFIEDTNANSDFNEYIF